MKCSLSNGCFGVALFLVTWFSVHAIAQERPVFDDTIVLAHGNISETASLSETIRRVQRTTGGLILGAERVPYDGHNINRVKYMDENGHVRYVDEPASLRPAPAQTSRPNSSPRRSDHH